MATKKKKWYKVVTAEGKGVHKKYFEYHLPKRGKPGAITYARNEYGLEAKEGDLGLCGVGIHVSDKDHITHWSTKDTDVIYEVEVFGKGLHDYDKSCFRAIRLLRKVGTVGDITNNDETNDIEWSINNTEKAIEDIRYEINCLQQDLKEQKQELADFKKMLVTANKKRKNIKW